MSNVFHMGQFLLKNIQPFFQEGWSKSMQLYFLTSKIWRYHTETFQMIVKTLEKLTHSFMSRSIAGHHCTDGDQHIRWVEKCHQRSCKPACHNKRIIWSAHIQTEVGAKMKRFWNKQVFSSTISISFFVKKLNHCLGKIWFNSFLERNTLLNAANSFVFEMDNFKHCYSKIWEENFYKGKLNRHGIASFTLLYRLTCNQRKLVDFVLCT